MSRPPSLKGSFVIPVYNGQAYLAEAIQSCLNQSVAAIEVIVVDDGSTDSTIKIAEYFEKKDKRVHLLKLPKNLGRSLARNEGIKLAKSDLIFTLDADDVALPSRVADTLNYLKKNPMTDLMYGKFQMIDGLGNVGGLAEVGPFDIERVRSSGFTYIGHSTMAFKRNVFEKVQYTNGPYSEHAIDDWKFQVDAYHAGFKFGAIPRILSQWRFSQKPRDEKAIAELKAACFA